MKQLGFKRLLLLSVMLLVGLSVSISSYISYSNTKFTTTDLIIHSGQDYIKGRAALVEAYLGEKINGVKGLGEFYKNNDFPGRGAQDYIALTEVLATALNTGSSFIGFEDTGEAYWNQETSAWPNHKFNGDIREQSYYQDGRRAVTPSVTDPYPDESNPQIYWISIVQKVKQGMLGVDMKLDFLTQLVKDSKDIAGSVALIANQDSTILASTSEAVEVGKKGVEYPWFKQAITQAINNESTYVHYDLNGVDKILFSHRIQVADKQWYFAIGLDTSVAFAMLESNKKTAIISAVVATGVSVLLAFALIQVLYRPILSLNRTIQDLASGDGDLTQRLQVTSNDELGTIALGVNKFIASLQVMLREIQDISNTLQSHVVQLKTQSQSNAAILQSHVSETEQVVAAIEEMNSTADSMATDAANTADITQQAEVTSVQSRKTLNQSQNTVSALIKDVESAADNVNRMSLETQEINKVLSVIGDIAEQTNLLALNAAIEAARAGEQGRGFAVVADEVRNLASRTKSSTEEVEVALSTLLKGTQVVVESMQNTKQRCQETADGSGEVGESLETMTTYVSEINTLSAQIATAAEEQSSVTQELSRNMSALNDIVGELDANGQRAVSDMDNIAAVNDKLVSIVGRFKL